jgi:NitT/TauT family transport system substrate-binding protein
MRRFGLGLLIAALAAAGGASASRAGEPVIFRLNFTPWGMHAQYYAALKQGFYAAEGLDVEIRPAAAGQRNEALIATGREQLGVTNADSFVLARATGLPVVAVMADQPDTPFSIFALKSSNITKPQDLKGKKLAWLQANIKGLVDPLLKAGGLTRSDIQYIEVGRGTEVQILAAGQVDAALGYYYGQPLTLEMRGFPTDVMPLKDYGVQFYGTVIYTSDSFAKAKAATVEKFLRATLKGLMWTKDHVEEAMNEVIAVAPDRDHALESRKLRMIYDLYAASPDYKERFGAMVPAKWQSSIDILAEGGDLQRKPTPSELYTNTFIEKLPETKQFADMLHAKSAAATR